MHWSDTPGSVKGPPPELGEHTAEVMQSLGFTADEIREVEERAGVARTEMLAVLVGE